MEQVLRAESRILDRFAQELLRRDELDYDEIVSIFLEYGKPPKSIPLSEEIPPQPLPVPQGEYGSPAELPPVSNPPTGS